MIDHKLPFILFDVDGTLTEPRIPITSWMIEDLKRYKTNVVYGIVSGSDYSKLREQLGEDGLKLFDYLCCENGLVSYDGNGECIHENSMITFIGESMYQDIINCILYELSQIKIKCKRGTFIELRTGMINVSPIGRGCTQEERESFYLYDQEYRIRECLRERLFGYKEFQEMEISIGGQISIDIYPRGWNKTYCLSVIPIKKYQNIYFFGDRMETGGNDYELSQDSRIIPISVLSPEDTIYQLSEIKKNDRSIG